MQVKQRQYLQLAPEIKTFFERQHRDSYELVAACRNEISGLYADGYNIGGINPENRCSIAATGVGLISLAVADFEGWEPAAHLKAKRTLEVLLGLDASCQPARDEQTGFFAHFIDMATGANLNSEISTIDTALLVAGALIAGEQFETKDPEIKKLAEELFTSIDWSVVYVPDGRGAINMVVEEGRGKMPLPPFTEYALVAYFAKSAHPENQELEKLWSKFWAPEVLDSLPQNTFRGLAVLTDRGAHKQGAYLSSFVHQFPFYLVPKYSSSASYREYFKNACLADRFKWQELNDFPSYVWGYGAGSDDGLFGGYHVNRINDAYQDVASAYIVAGFLPVYPGGIYDLYALYKNHFPYDLKGNTAISSSCPFGLHRYSFQKLLKGENAFPTRITVVDWGSMLYGLTAFKYGMDFFRSRLP